MRALVYMFHGHYVLLCKAAGTFRSAEDRTKG